MKTALFIIQLILCYLGVIFLILEIASTLVTKDQFAISILVYGYLLLNTYCLRSKDHFKK